MATRSSLKILVQSLGGDRSLNIVSLKYRAMLWALKSLIDQTPTLEDKFRSMISVGNTIPKEHEVVRRLGIEYYENSRPAPVRYYQTRDKEKTGPGKEKTDSWTMPEQWIKWFEKLEEKLELENNSGSKTNKSTIKPGEHLVLHSVSDKSERYEDWDWKSFRWQRSQTFDKNVVYKNLVIQTPLNLDPDF